MARALMCHGTLRNVPWYVTALFGYLEWSELSWIKSIYLFNYKLFLFLQFTCWSQCKSNSYSYSFLGSVLFELIVQKHAGLLSLVLKRRIAHFVTRTNVKYWCEISYWCYFTVRASNYLIRKTKVYFLCII